MKKTRLQFLATLILLFCATTTKAVSYAILPADLNSIMRTLSGDYDYTNIKENTTIEVIEFYTLSRVTSGTLISKEDSPIYAKYDSNMKTITFYSDAQVYRMKDYGRFFYGLSSLKRIINLNRITIGNITNMSGMFYGCSSLESLDLRSFTTENVKNMSGMFYGCSSLKDLDLSNFTTENVTDMSSMFYGCSSLESLDLSNFTTENVKNMSGMFYGCSSLKYRNLRRFNTQNVTDMSSMFSDCSKLTSLNICSFNTQNVTNMSSMFSGCSSLDSLNLSSFNTQNVTNMSSMFSDCSSLDSLNLSSFNTQNVTNMSSMFSNCSSLDSLDLSSFNTENVLNMNKMFYGCSSLTSLNVSNFNTQNVKETNEMFYGCSSLISLDLSSFNTENVLNMNKMFYNCSSLTFLDISNFNTNGSCWDMFYNCLALRLISVGSKVFTPDNSSLNSKAVVFCPENSIREYERNSFWGQYLIVDRVNSASDAVLPKRSNLIIKRIAGYGFEEVKFQTSSLQTTDIQIGLGSHPIYIDYNTYDKAVIFYTSATKFVAPEKFTWTENVDETPGLFNSISGLKKITNLNALDTRNMTDMSYMFDDCSSLTSIDLSNFNTQNVKDMTRMFSGCSSLTSLDVSNFNTQNVTGMGSMFSGCSSLTSLDVSNFNTQNVSYMGCMFWGCSSLTSLDVSNFNTQNVTDMGGIFGYCSSLTSLDLSSFNTQKVTSMSYMFEECSALTSLDISSFNTEKLTGMSHMFEKCDALKSIYVGSTVFTPYNCTSPFKSKPIVFCPENSLSSYDNNSFWSKYTIIVDYANSAPDAVLPKRSNRIIKWIAGSSVEEIRFETSSLQTTDIKICFGSNPIYIDFNTSNNTVTFYTSANKFVAPEKFIWRNSYDETNGLFNSIVRLKKITNLNALDTRNMTNMRAMFYSCYSLPSLDVSSFNTQNVKETLNMFVYCSSLKYLNICPNLSTNGDLHSNAIVTCPEDTYDTYVNDPFFGQYQVVKLNPIDGGTLGDVNNDTDTDVQDLYYAAKGIMAQKDANIYFLPADINHDNELTATDHEGITNIILGRSHATAKNSSKSDETQYGDDILRASVNMPSWNSGTITFDFSNAEGLAMVTGIQMDIAFGEGIIPECNADGSLMVTCMDTNHAIASEKQYDGSYRIVVSSINNSAFADSKLFTLPFSVNEGMYGQTSSVAWTNITYVLSDGTKMHAVDDNVSFELKKTVKVSNITLSSSLSMVVGNTTTLSASVSPSNAADKSLTWTSSNPSVAKVSSTGLVEGITTGTATITATANDGSGVSATCVVTVKKYNYATLPTNLNNIMLELSGDYTNDCMNTTIEEIEFKTGSSLTPGPLISNEDSPIYVQYNSSKKKITLYTDAQAYMMKNGTSFKYLTSLKSIVGLNTVNTVKMTNMSSMFRYCSSLTSLDVSNFNTQNVTDMSGMFSCCSSLTSLDLSNFNTQNVTDMSGMFDWCRSLTSFDVSNFNTQNVTKMEGMFYGCSSLTSLDLSNFNTQKVTNMSSIFSSCYSLTSLDVSSFNTQNVTNMSSMFRYCSSLTSLDVSNFNTQNVTDMSGMFSGCSSLTSLDLSNFNTQNVTDMSGMFSGCSSLTPLDLSNFNTQNVTDMSGMFYDCSSLTSLDISNFKTQNVTNMDRMFEVLSSLTSISVGSTVFTPTESAFYPDVIVFCPENSISSYESNSFWGQYLIVDRISSTSDAVLPKRSHQIMKWLSWNTSIEEVRFQTSSFQTSGIKISFGSYPVYIDFNTSNNTVTFYTTATKFVAPDKFIWRDYNNNYERSGLFADFADLKKITNLNALDTRNMTSMSDMFYDCRALTSLDISNFNTENVTDMSQMFYGCASLKYLNVCPNLSTTGTLHGNAIVTCPEDTYNTYVNDSFCGQYQVVKLNPTDGGTFGDVNNDTDRDVQDLYYVAKGIMAQKDANIYFLPADINQDKELTAADYVGVTNIILGRSYAAAAKGANKLEDTQYSDDILSATIGDGAMSIALDNMRDYTAMQMDVTLPEGAAIQKAVRSDRLTASHNVAVAQLADNKWRVLLTSAQNATMKGFNGELFSLTLNGAEKAKAATIDNIQLVEPTMATQYLNAIEATSETTGVGNASAERNAEGAAYGIDGISHNNMKGVKSGIYVRGNKKVMVK